MTHMKTNTMARRLFDFYMNNLWTSMAYGNLMGAPIGCLTGACVSTYDGPPSFARTTAFSTRGFGLGAVCGTVAGAVYPVLLVSAPVYAWHRYGEQARRFPV
jgi:hypothetical protein